MTALKALPIAHVSCTQLEGLTDSCKDALIGKGLSEIGLSFFFHFFPPEPLIGLVWVFLLFHISASLNHVCLPSDKIVKGDFL